MKNQYKKGSEWRKWDLHIHTPKSIYQQYGPDNIETWEKYIKDLEGLPKEFAVLGINDYLFLDGYEKLKYEQDNNERLAGLKLLPVVEFRIEKFAGVQFGKLNRINLHVIFSDKLSVETIRSQFLNTLEQSYFLESGEKWQRAITKESVSELGKEIKSTVPEEELKKYGSDLFEGFKNLNVKEEQIFKSLEKDCFRDKYIIAIGKTEWGDLKWSDQSIATKKTIINSADIVFTSSESIENFNKGKSQLQKQKVNDLLLDCSDAHYFSDSDKKDRIGNCNTWLKGDPTFDGLRQILIETDERIFIGDEPGIFNRVRTNRTKYIKSLEINYIDGYNGINGKWFNDINIDFNKELIAIIGNKGSGKSALSDIVALCSNFKNDSSYSFLRVDKFKKAGLASKFNGKLSWESGAFQKKNLNETTDISKPERVKYLPQGDFEKLTNEIEKAEAFQNEIENVVFSHIPEEDRLTFDSFADLMQHMKQIANESIQSLQIELGDINNDIFQLEKKINPIYKAEIEAEIKRKNEEIEALVKPAEVKNPNDNPELAEKNKDTIKILEETRRRIKENEKQYSLRKTLKKLKTQDLDELNNVIQAFKNKEVELTRFLNEKKLIVSRFKTDINKVFKFEINFELLDVLAGDVSREILKLETEINDFTKRIEADKKKEIEETNKLDAPQKKYQKYLSDLNIWKTKRKELIGDDKKPGTLNYFNAIMRYLSEELQTDISMKRLERLGLVKKIFEKKKSIIELYESAKKGIDIKIGDNKELLSEYEINIETSLIFKNDFINKFLDFINKRQKGSFSTIEGGMQQLRQIIDDKDFNCFADLETVLVSLTRALFEDLRQDISGSKERYVEDQVIDVVDFYNYLFGLDYIDYNYQLKLGDKELVQLSPGERGALLLIFYLLLDNNDIPLVLDQPEDNLDNHSVANVLVPFIKRAKQKRQIILVTHNPNLAVVADAEQIIWVNINKDDNNRFEYESGSIESKIINKHIVDVLEGAMPAFNKRKRKYYDN
jgi:ABC-type lipoprotein export system ATPase subunit/phage host-nuclease inhibitor protein Gam